LVAPRSSAGILAEMDDDGVAAEVSGEAAQGALAYLTEMSPDLRGAAVFGPGGEVLAGSGHADRWREDAAALFEVADRAGGEPVEQVHIGAEQGEVFALRHAGLAAVAVTERFALASLVLFDMRTMLRDLAGETSQPTFIGPEHDETRQRRGDRG
jgi:hypothetical protein